MMRAASVGLFLLPMASSGVAELQISEFMAANAETLADADGDFSDWIEIYNPDVASMPLVGHYLTDDPENLTKWSFPEDAAISGEGYVIVFASSKDRTGEEWHTNFNLNADGESLLLVAPDGETILDAFQNYPEQRSGFSYSDLFHAEPTPGMVNGSGVLGFVADTKFSVDRGFYDEPVVVEITTATPEARILYTTDGSEPSIFSGKVYTEPITISKTTILRALARKGQFLDSNLDTQTYLFLDDVLEQDGEGLPNPPNPAMSDWDYEMDPNVVTDPRYASALKDDLKKLRTMSVVMPVNDLWSGRGLYANPTQLGPDWERGCSVEILDPNDNTANIQEDAGLRMQGAGSRFRNLGKKSMRLAFRSTYGAPSFRYPLFGETQPTSFDTIVLRGSYFDSWTVHAAGSGMGIGWRNALQFRTDFGHLTHRDMGAHGILSDWVHLYLNGQYWGIYNIHERPDEAFAALHLGGDEEDYDILKQRPRGQANGSTPELVNGSLEAWASLMSLIREDVSNDAIYQEVLTRIDLDQFIDYILMNLWGGNQDWPHNNWYAVRNRASDGPFIFYTWDPENYLFDVNVNQTGVDTNNSPGILFSRLRANADFRLRFADRVHHHLFNDGALSVTANTKRFQHLVDKLQGPMNAESARWGDSRTEPPLNTIDTWLPTVDEKLNEYIPRRHDIVLSQLRAAGLYPTVDAPEFPQHGGDVEASYTLTLPTSLFSETYYTLDGSDPSEDDAILYTEPILLSESTLVKARMRSNTRWSALTEAWFRIATVDASSDSLEISEIHPRDDFEFLELTNTSDQIVDLSGLRFAKGIRFTFAERTTIPPQGRLVLVRNATAFTARYPDRDIGGEYRGSLNNGGERLLLVDGEDATVIDLEFGDNKVESEALKLFIITGQSNSLGVTNGGEEDPSIGNAAADAHVPFFWHNVADASTTVGTSGGVFVTLAEQQGGFYPGSPTHWGPEVAFARSLYRAGVRNFGVIKASRGGGGNTHWRKSSNGHMYSLLTDTVEAAAKDLAMRGQGFEIAGLLYIQGESDSAAEAGSAGQRIKELADNLRADLPNADSMHTVIGGIAASGGNRNTVRANQANIAEASANIDYFETLDQRPNLHDGLHYNKAAKQTVGERFAQSFFGTGIVSRHYGQLVFVGDSITQGGNNRPSYRYKVFQNLAEKRVPIDAVKGYKFVGSLSGAFADSVLTTPGVDGQAFENRHDGHWGWRASWLNGRDRLPSGRRSSNRGEGTIVNWTGQASPQEYRISSPNATVPFPDGAASGTGIFDSAEAYVPDTAIIMIGINDLADGTAPEQVRDDISLIIDQLRGANGNVRIHLCETLYSNNVAFAKVDVLNALLPQLAANKNAESAESPVWVIDTNRSFDPGTMTYDNTHPNAEGEVLVGNRLSGGLALIETPEVAAEPDPVPSPLEVEAASSSFDTKFDGNEIWDTRFRNQWADGGNAPSTSLVDGSPMDLRVRLVGSGASWIEGTGAGWDEGNDGNWTFETRLKFDANPSGYVLWLGTDRHQILVEIYGDRTQDFGGDSFNVSHNNLDGQFHTFRVAHDAEGERYHVWRDGESLTGDLGVGYDTGTTDSRLILGDYTRGSFGNNYDVVIEYVRFDLDGAFLPPGGDVEPGLKINEVRLGEGNVRVTWTSRRGTVYTIEGSATLEAESFEPVATDIPAEGGTTTATAESLSPGVTKKFFRVREQ